MDLRDPEREGKSRDIRFVDRVFTTDEKALISGSEEPDRMLWTLWAGKEAAFKVMRKSYPSVSSSPRDYRIVPDDPRTLCDGRAETPEGPVQLSFSHDEETVHAIGTEEYSGNGKMFWGIEAADGGKTAAVFQADLSLLAREALIRRLSENLGCKPPEMEVRRYRDHRGLGPPQLFINGHRSVVDISLSHDGRFVAYAFCPFNLSSKS